MIGPSISIPGADATIDDLNPLAAVGLDTAEHPWWSRALRQLRRRHDLSQRDLAAHAGVAPSTIADLEIGRVSPSVRLLDTVLGSLGYHLELVDTGGESMAWYLADDNTPRDAAGRRFPPHLDVHERYPGSSTARPSILVREPPWQYHRQRAYRDTDRTGGDFGVWGAGPPMPGFYDREYLRAVMGDLWLTMTGGWRNDP